MRRAGDDRRPAVAGDWRRDFRCFWAGESASLLGGQVLLLALPLTAVLTLHATPGQLGLLGAVASAPYLVFGIPAGVAADRWPRRRILIASDVAQCVAIGVIPLLAAAGRLTFWWLLVAAGVAGIGKVFFSVAYRSYLPTIVPRRELTKANSRLTLSESAAEIAGPGLGGLLVQHVGAPLALVVDAVSYLASAGGYAAVRAREARPRATERTKSPDVMGGLRVVFRDPYLRSFLGEAASYNLCWQLVNIVFVLFAVTTLGMSAGLLGVLLSVGAVGAILGAALTDRAARCWGLGRTVIMAAVIGDLAPLLLPAAQRGPWAAPLLAVAFFIQGLGITACNVHTMSLRQSLTPAATLGRVNAAYLLVAQGVRPIGALLGGWLGGLVGVRVTLIVGAVALLSTSVFLIASPLRRVRTADDVLRRRDHRSG